MGPRTTGGVDRLDPVDDMEETVDTTDDVEVTRVRIEQTRADISETLDAIKEKLEPQTLMEQAKEKIHDVTADVAQQARETVHHVVQEAKQGLPEAAHNAVSSAVDTAKEAVGSAVDSARDAVGSAVGTARDAGSSVIETIWQNPIPYTLIGAGLSWLYFSSRRHGAWERRSPEQYRYMPGYEYPTGYESGYYPGATADSEMDALRYGERGVRGGYAGGSRETYRPGTMDTGGSAAGETWRQAKEKVGDVTETVQEKAGHVAERVQEKAGQAVDRVQETVSHLGERAAGQAHYAAEGFQRKLDESPLMMGAIALGLGAVLGFMVPETRREHRMMGEARDRLVENVQHTAQEVAQKVQTVAEETVDTAKETAKQEARNQGLTAS